MLNLLNWEKPLKVNGKIFPNSTAAYNHFKSLSGDVTIELNIETSTEQKETPKTNTTTNTNTSNEDQLIEITVKKYMTQPSTPSFDFMKKWNNDNPMPMVTMVGRKLDETKGMVKMELWGSPRPAKACLHCGRKLTHPVSLLYGIGPVCGKHYHINPFDNEDELKKHYNEIKEQLGKVRWTGWVIKSAIKEKHIVNEKETVHV